MADAFVAGAVFDQGHPPALALYCSDGRFTAAVEELAAHLGHPRLDTVTLPGGAALLDQGAAMLSDRDALSRALALLVDRHAIRFVLLVGHQGCGYYAARHPLLDGERLRARQQADLRGARDRLRQAWPGLEVALFFARPDRQRVSFEPVP